MKALLIVDVQNDFLSGGSLAIEEGEEIIPIINSLQKCFDFVIATQDWHPKNHNSFASIHQKNVGETILLKGKEQILWPTHCVQNTKGAGFHPKLNLSNFNKIFRKGEMKDIDSYSGFFDNHKEHNTGLNDYLKKNSVVDVYVSGLATDYCVKFTALDALSLGFNTFLIKDACQGVEREKGDIEKALKEITNKGGIIISSKEILHKFSSENL